MKKKKNKIEHIKIPVNLKDLGEFIISGGVHSVPPVSVQADIHLDIWRVFEVTSTSWPNKTRHFVGYNVFGREGRVSTPIKTFNREDRVGKTESGRSYLLSKSSGFERDALYVWDRFCKINGITNIKDVTEEYE